jgi:hypothetical protein
MTQSDSLDKHTILSWKVDNLQFSFMSVSYYNLVFNVTNIRTQLLAHAGSYNNIRLAILMLIECQEFVYGLEKEMEKVEIYNCKKI